MIHVEFKKRLVDVDKTRGQQGDLKDTPLFNLSSVRFRIVSPSPSLTCSLDDTGTAEIGIDFLLVKLTIRCNDSVLTYKQILITFHSAFKQIRAYVFVSCFVQIRQCAKHVKTQHIELSALKTVHSRFLSLPFLTTQRSGS